jgi:hypothetical protein
MAHLVAPQAGTDLDDIWFYVAVDSGSRISLPGWLIPLQTSSSFWPGFLRRVDPASVISEPACEVFLRVNL